MITISIAGLTQLLNLTKANNTSVLVRRQPGRGVIAAVKAVYPDIACITASSMSGVYQEAQVAAFFVNKLVKRFCWIWICRNV